MTFWDSSALLPLIVEEARSRACRQVRKTHPAIVVWALTRTELTSAIHRLVREGRLERAELAAASRRVEILSDRWSEITALGAVRERAERALGAHPLTAADALQLGAALLLVGERPRRRPFVTCDDRLGAAAEAEGFTVVTPRS
ncbi:MAG: type II toxin-antitoxin system VapC family toxin [Deltaproteobacteria bacterium]|nr:type II toxin-antitoxin system VapC family toxin [Deltaproteobacteria bacterium]